MPAFHPGPQRPCPEWGRHRQSAPAWPRPRSIRPPNPCLLPTRREREEQYTIVRRAIAAVERRGGTADGQITATRSAGRTIAKAARRRRVRYVVMDDSAPSGVRRVTEGAVTAIVRRRLGDGATLELVGPGARIS